MMRSRAQIRTTTLVGGHLRALCVLGGSIAHASCVHWCTDGSYVPRIYFVNPSGKVAADLINEGGNPEFKYFYGGTFAVRAPRRIIPNVRGCSRAVRRFSAAWTVRWRPSSRRSVADDAWGLALSPRTQRPSAVWHVRVQKNRWRSRRDSNPQPQD
jgi:hypothetical protein